MEKNVRNQKKEIGRIIKRKKGKKERNERMKQIRKGQAIKVKEKGKSM